MSDIPTPSPALGGPQTAFENLLNIIISTTNPVRMAKVRPHLLTFISHPIIKELIGESDAPAQTFANTTTDLALQMIQDSLQQLSRTVEALKKAPPLHLSPTKMPM